MGKQYTTAPILVNSNGDPIPQYLDITDKTDSPQGTFKPLTNETIQKVQLTGSYVIRNYRGQTDNMVSDVANYGNTAKRGSASIYDPLNLKDVQNVYIRIENQYDVSLYITLRVFDENGDFLYNVVSNETLAAGATKEYFIKDRPLIGFSVQTYKSPRPTTGNLNVLIIGG